MRKIIICLAAFAMAGIASAVNTTNYVDDGQFESPDNGGAGPWLNTFGGDTIIFSPVDGNPNGCAQITDGGSFGGFAYVNPPGASTQPTLASLGLVAGQTYTFVMDMRIAAGASIGGLKIESWSDAAPSLGDSGDMRPLSGTTSWATYTFTYKIKAGATHLNIVPLWGANSTVYYDNIGVIIPGPAPATVSITSPTNNQVVYSNFTINATATVNPGAVTNVNFYVDNIFAGKATSSPFAYIATGVPAGAHALKAVAQDNNGNAATSSVVNITVTNAPIPPFGAYESFNYTSLTSGTASTGTGFAGNWSCGAAGTIVSGLTYPNLSVADNALQSSSSYQLETLATTPSGVGTVWVSFIFNQAGDNGGNRDGFVLEDSTGKGVMFAYQQFQATIGNPALTTVSGFTAVGSQLSPNSGTTQTYAANNFYVLKLSYTGGSLSSVAVYSNPTAGPGQTTPPAADFTVSSGLSGIGALSVLGVVHQAGMALTVDEVRVGATYASVVGADLNPTVPTTLALSIAESKKISWSAISTNFYQPQSSTDGVNWNNLGSVLYGTGVTSVYDIAPVAFYQVQEILPATTEILFDGGFELSDGGSGAFYWPSGGSQPPTQIATDFHSGTASMQLFVTNSTAAAQICDLQQNNFSDGGPGITAGSTYTFSFWAKSLGKNPAGGYVQQYKVTWLNASSAVVGAVGFNNFTGGNGTWTQTTTGPVVAPANAVNVLIEIRIATGGITNDFGGVLVDDASLSSVSPGNPGNVLSPTIQSGVVFTANVQTNGVLATAATGNITFRTNSVVQSTGSVAGGSASGTPTTVPASYTVTATYLGDATYIGSSANLTVGSGVNTTPTNVVASVSGNQITLSWPADHTGWILQAQTNSTSVGLSATWYDVAGSTTTNRMVIGINPTKPAVFYRLKF